ncbi:MAG: sulfate reduction electron transfer complex DsrMKJOP subunit DsrJ [Acidobacteria bacterium]|nr:sulfate reduction electron transfer complex DsrMKJOP subunit DsrJ [Acidobacteriota bacterium]
MRDRAVIIVALACFLVVLSTPVWYARAAGVTAKAPELKRPATEKACVMPVAYMRASHMDLLMTWRDDVVRRNARTWVSPDGKTFTKSLTGTCLRCHANKAEFCDRCHAYSNVTPYCWDCHVDPALIQRSGP